MRTMLLLYAAFIGISLLLWSGCIGHRNNAGHSVSAATSLSVTR